MVRTSRFQCGNAGSIPAGATRLMESFKNNFEEKKEMKEENESIVPESEIVEQFSRSGGHGGQNVNKLSTKAEVRWNIDESKAFNEEEREKIKQILSNKINKKGELIVVSQEERSQLQNRERAVERLNNLIKAALVPEKERKATKPTRASKERRLTEKRRLGEKKMWRKKPAQGWSA